ncbi:hypothetical protein LV469_01930 [Peptoniphilus sp. GNH]|nr:hypothetical protein LV469_01930 [Peptoniphilus sp. GNH]
MKESLKKYNNIGVNLILISALLGLILSLSYVGVSLLTQRPDHYEIKEMISFVIIVSFVLSAFVLYPMVLSIFQIYSLIKTLKDKENLDKHLALDIWTIVLGFFYQMLYLAFIKEVDFSANWEKQLVNSQLHSPIRTTYYIPLFIFFIISIMSILYLRRQDQKNLPPLVNVFCISILYFDIAMLVVWSKQIISFENTRDLILILPCVITTIIAIKTILISVKKYKPDEHRIHKINNNPILYRLNFWVINSKKWPILALILSAALLGLAIVILMLFGQAPHSLIKAFTETSDWNLSDKIAPDNISIDEHYLCTVAARGHKKIVRPIRRGYRHGYEVVVNRQLMVANAFEDLIEDRLPKTHKFIRRFYDKYGYAFAKKIKSKYAMDVIWIIMKPFEIIFLICLYLFDEYPEDRINIQYTGKSTKELLK